MRPAIEVAAGLLWRGDRILVCQRARGSRHEGKWEFPGGKIDPGESAQQCLRRELQEELGVRAVVGRRLWTTEHTDAGGLCVRLAFFDVVAYEGEVTNRVFDQIRWVPVAELGEIDFLEADRELVAWLMAGGMGTSAVSKSAAEVG